MTNQSISGCWKKLNDDWAEWCVGDQTIVGVYRDETSEWVYATGHEPESLFIEFSATLDVAILAAENLLDIEPRSVCPLPPVRRALPFVREWIGKAVTDAV